MRKVCAAAARPSAGVAVLFFASGARAGLHRFLFYQTNLSRAALLLIACLLLYLALVPLRSLTALSALADAFQCSVIAARGRLFFSRSRARSSESGNQDALSELAWEVNALADLLQKQRSGRWKLRLCWRAFLK